MDEDKKETGLTRVLRVPENQEERITAATLGVVSVASSVGIVLLKGISSLFLPGFIIAAAVGGISYWVLKKYPAQRPIAIVIASVAGITLLNAIPGFRAFGGFLLAAGAVITAGFGVWKLASTIFSVFKKKD